MDDLVLPNVRKLFIPTPGYTILDCDEAGADAQVVAWEAEDEDLKNAFRAGIDVHVKNATDMLGTKFTSLSEDDPKRKKLRQSNKHAVHGTNYGARPAALVAHPAIDMNMHEADQFQKRWFGLHPGIRQWQLRVEASLQRQKSVTNAFGFTIPYFDRVDLLLPQALAWVPQSTVALIASKAMNKIETNLDWVEMLLQVHDSLVMQIPITHFNRHRLLAIKEQLQVVVPYPDPLIIPFSLSASEKSWGDCKKQPWPKEEAVL